MSMSAAYLAAIADAGAALVTHFGLVDDTGTELTGGSYARVANVPAASGTSDTWRPSADLDFNVPAGVTVGGWRAYSAASAGTDYGGDDLTPEVYAGAGTYTLVAAQTGVTHAAGA
jgi:hypothetical protein